MNTAATPPPQKQKGSRRQTPTFLLELPLVVTQTQAKRLRAHLEAARQFYNAVLSQGQWRLRHMRADPAWTAARAIPRVHKQERATAFRALRAQYGFSEYALQQAAKVLRVSWIAEHLDAVLAQTLATRAYRALNQVCLGQARRVRFKSHARGLSSIENKRNDTALHFVLQQAEDGNQGFLIWKGDRLAALIDWNDPLVTHGLAHRIKYARLIQRRASSSRAAGADRQGCRYYVQLALEGTPPHKPKHAVGTETIGLDLGPASIAVVPREGEATLSVFCEELAPEEKTMRRLQRKMDRQRRATNPDNYDERGRINKRAGKKKLVWKQSKSYQKTRQSKAARERKLAAHRKSLHGRKVHEIVAVGNTILLEKISYKAWQKQYGKSVGLRAPGMFVALLRRTGAAHGRHPDRNRDTHGQAEPVLSRLREMREKAPLAALASLRLWSGPHPAGPVFRLSGFNSGSRSSHPLVCPGGHSLGSFGGEAAGRTRASAATRE